MTTVISIIVPVFNRHKQLEQLFQSLTRSIDLAKARSTVEIIIVDDCSDSPVSINHLKENVLLLRNARRVGAPASRKLGYLHAKGDFIHFHDSDDSFHEDWVASVLEVVKKNSCLDILLTGRKNIRHEKISFIYQKYVDKHVDDLERIRKRLIYRNCFGPLGGVTFSRRAVEQMSFRSMASCQDWQMYLDAMPSIRKIVSRPDITFNFTLSGDDRISHDPSKKLLGHLQLSHFTGRKSLFGNSLRLFYLMTWRKYFKQAHSGGVNHFYQRHRLRMWLCFLVISVYWRIY